MKCFDDDFEACIAHQRLPVRHRRSTRTTNLIELSLPAARLTNRWPSASVNAASMSRVDSPRANPNLFPANLSLHRSLVNGGSLLLSWLRLATTSSARFGGRRPYSIVQNIPYVIPLSLLPWIALSMAPGPMLSRPERRKPLFVPEVTRRRPSLDSDLAKSQQQRIEMSSQRQQWAP